jgi:hypothetical protein
VRGHYVALLGLHRQLRHHLPICRNHSEREDGCCRSLPPTRRIFGVISPKQSMAQRRGAVEMAQLVVILMCPSERDRLLPCAFWRPRPQNGQRHKMPKASALKAFSRACNHSRRGGSRPLAVGAEFKLSKVQEWTTQGLGNSRGDKVLLGPAKGSCPQRFTAIGLARKEASRTFFP